MARIQALDVERETLNSELNEIRRVLGIPTGPAASTRRRARPASQRRDKPFRPGTTVYWAQEALRYRGQAVHIDQLVEDVYRLSGTKVEKSSLVGNLSRYVRQGVVFNRPGEAQYGLIEFQEEPHPTHVA